MSLGLLAKDSIQDLEALARESAKEEYNNANYNNNFNNYNSYNSQNGDLTTTTAGTESTNDGGLFIEDTDDGATASSTTFSVPSMEPIEAAESAAGTSTSEARAGAEKVAAAAATQDEPPKSGISTAGSDTASDALEEAATSYGKYTEFSSAYYDPYQFKDYYMTSYGAPSLPVNPNSPSANGFWQSLLPCLFPWTSPGLPSLEGSETASKDYNNATEAEGAAAAEEVEEEKKADSAGAVDGTSREHAVAVSTEPKLLRSSSTGESDDVSTGSDALGEKLSNKERNAMLAKLGFPPPEAGEDSSEAEGSVSKKSKKQRGLLNDLQQYDPSTGLLQSNDTPKGILKRGNVVVAPTTTNGGLKHDNSSGRDLARNSTAKKIINPQRRSLFPQAAYESTIIKGNSGNAKSVSFAPMARVVTVKSKNNMDEKEKGAIWWQKADYDDFRKTGRIITRAMLEGGSEVWLSSERCTGKKGGLNGRSKKSENNKDETGAQDPITSTGDKWWHKFGHSRRGLEHVVSVEEGKQRQLNVRCAIRALIDEQSRQMMYNRVDPEKLRMVSLQYTSWARDLALASGSSDADAVSSSFSDERKTREFFLLKMARGESSGKSVVPEFMQPSLHGVPGPHRLDANTSAQIRFRRQTQSTTGPAAGQQTTNNNHGGANNNGVVRPTLESQNSFRTEDEASEPVHDRETNESSMARRAAGYTAGENAQRVDMSAVLSGMGAVPRSSPPVSSRA